MRIQCLTAFLDGPVRFEKDDICSVPDEDAAHFISHGWAQPAGGDDAPQAASPAPADATNLDIHDATLGAGDSNG